MELATTQLALLMKPVTPLEPADVIQTMHVTVKESALCKLVVPSNNVTVLEIANANQVTNVPLSETAKELFKHVDPMKLELLMELIADHVAQVSSQTP